MKNNSKIVAIIPARGGSKSIPYKNIKRLGGIPLIAYSIVAAKASGLIHRTIVSTDDERIAEVATKYGAEVPFLRPESLSGDDVLDFPVFEHAVHWLELSDGYKPDILVQVRPTSPFRPVDLLDDAIEKLLANPDADCVRAVTPSGENPYKMWKLQNGIIRPILQSDLFEPYNKPRQALPATFWQTGHVEVIRYNTIMKKKSLTGDVILPVEVPRIYAIDLDTQEQWQYAEYLLEKMEFDIILPERPDNQSIRHKYDQPQDTFDFF